MYPSRQHCSTSINVHSTLKETYKYPDYSLINRGNYEMSVYKMYVIYLAFRQTSKFRTLYAQIIPSFRVILPYRENSSVTN